MGLELHVSPFSLIGKSTLNMGFEQLSWESELVEGSQSLSKTIGNWTKLNLKGKLWVSSLGFFFFFPSAMKSSSSAID